MIKPKDAIIHKGVPFAVAFAFYAFGAPWYLAAVALFSAVYWYGPVLVYLRQRMPTVPSLRALDPDEPLPPAHSRVLDARVPLLQGEGFVQLGRLASVGGKQSILGTVVLLQHQETSDLAHLLIASQEGRAEPVETLAFSRVRTDGSRIVTSRNTIQSPFPPSPRDSVLRLDGRITPLDLWRVHRARVAADAGATRNVVVTDALGFQVGLERDSVRKHLASGLWQQDERPEFLRPTPRGAVLMCLRMLAPWKQIARLHARSQMRRYLRESRTQQRVFREP